MVGTQEIRGSLNIDRPVTGYGFADYMLGMISGTRSAGALGEGWYRAISQAYFIQDTWRMQPNVTLDLGTALRIHAALADVKGEMMNIWIPPGFGTPSQQGKPCFIRVGSGDPYEGVATRFDPAICVARDGRLGDRLIAADKNELCAPHRRGMEPIAEDDGANRLRHFLRAGLDQPGLRYEPQHPGAHYRAESNVDARATLRRRRHEPLRCPDAAAGVRHGAAGSGQSNTIAARPTSNSTSSISSGKSVPARPWRSGTLAAAGTACSGSSR